MGLAFEKLVLAQSVQGHPLELFLFNTRPASESKALDTLFLGTFHGDEGIAGELMLRLIDELVQLGPDEIEQYRLYKPLAIVPVVNPDGLAVQTRVNAAGVDLNRNFPTQDWLEENQETPYYSGRCAASEPETQGLIQLIEAYRPQKIVTVHSPYRVLNYDGPAQTWAEALSQLNGYPATASIGYPTPGSFGTYTGVERQIPVITWELPEDEPLEVVWKNNRQALLTAVQYSF